jgi:hypothetical protein
VQTIVTYRFLPDKAYLLTPPSERHIPEVGVAPAEHECSTGGVIEALQHGDNRRLPGAGWSHESGGLSSLNRKINRFENRPVETGGVGKIHALKVYRTIK